MLLATAQSLTFPVPRALTKIVGAGAGCLYRPHRRLHLELRLRGRRSRRSFPGIDAFRGRIRDVSPSLCCDDKISGNRCKTNRAMVFLAVHLNKRELSISSNSDAHSRTRMQQPMLLERGLSRSGQSFGNMSTRAPARIPSSHFVSPAAAQPLLCLTSRQRATHLPSSSERRRRAEPDQGQ
jgi:hypothetical protein